MLGLVIENRNFFFNSCLKLFHCVRGVSGGSEQLQSHGEEERVDETEAADELCSWSVGEGVDEQSQC